MDRFASNGKPSSELTEMTNDEIFQYFEQTKEKMDHFLEHVGKGMIKFYH